MNTTTQIKVDQIHNGEIVSTIECSDSLPETIRAAIVSAYCVEDGWRVRVRGSVEALNAVGARDVGGRLVFKDSMGLQWGCTVG